MKNNKYMQYKRFTLNTLTLSILVASTGVHALQALPDAELRAINGQDGVHITANIAEANIDQIYWEDQAGRGTSGATNTTLKATGDVVKIRKSNSSTLPLSADLKIDTGSSGNNAGLDLNAQLSPALISVDSIKVCDTESTARCSATLGSVAIQTSSTTDFHLKTPKGMFSPDNMGELTLGLKNAHIYLGQMDVSNQLNQLILKNFNFNFRAIGTIFVDANEGLKMQTNTRLNGVDQVASLTATPNANFGYADLTRVADPASTRAGFNNTGSYGNNLTGANGLTTNSGLNIEFMLSKNVDKNAPYTIDALSNSANAKGLIRLGASGRLVNSSITVRGTQGNTATLGNASGPTGATTNNNVMGSTGIAARVKTEFTKDNDTMLAGGGQATTLEIGGAGLGVYGFELVI